MSSERKHNLGEKEPPAKRAKLSPSARWKKVVAHAEAHRCFACKRYIDDLLCKINGTLKYGGNSTLFVEFCLDCVEGWMLAEEEEKVPPPAFCAVCQTEKPNVVVDFVDAKGRENGTCSTCILAWSLEAKTRPNFVEQQRKQ